jgi:ABC-2 type transport system ATP-binding protein
MIEVEHLTKVYGSTRALKDVTFKVEPGEILGLLGPNGAGKTTTMRILAGYLPASSGSAKVAGYEVHDQPMQVRQRIGYLPENPPLYTDMSIEGYLHFVARIKGVSAGDRAQRVNVAMDSCNLTDRRKTIIRKLSKGYKQRVGIAQAIVHDPPAIILDEPTVGLDPRQINEVRNLIKTLAGQKTVILSTHILPEVSMTCNRVAIISQGQVVETGSLDDLMSRLTGGTSYDLEVEGHPDMIKRQLQPLTGVTSLEWLPPSPDQHQRLRVMATGEPELGRNIAQALVQANLGLYEMRRSAASLEDVFLKLTTIESTDTGANGENGTDATPDRPVPNRLATVESANKPTDIGTTDVADEDNTTDTSNAGLSWQELLLKQRANKNKPAKNKPTDPES